MTEPVLTPRELNRAVLARQLLLQRAPLAPAEALERVAGLQTQYAPTGYVGLWSRTTRPDGTPFRPADLTEALLERRVVQAWVMRCTIHMVSPADYRPWTEAVRAARRALWTPPPGVDMEAVARLVRGHLADGPLTQAQLVARLTDDGLPKSVWAGVQLWIDLVRVPPAGTWGRPRAHVYGLADAWLPPGEPVSEEAGREDLVRRYLRGFGPASAKDVGLFCGWNVTASRAVLARLELRRFRDVGGKELFDVPDAPLPGADVVAPVRFVGPWDALLMTQARRAEILPEPYRPRVFAVPQSVGTFLVDGQVAGSWRPVDGEVVWEPFGELSAAAREEVAAEADRLAVLYR